MLKFGGSDILYFECLKYIIISTNIRYRMRIERTPNYGKLGSTVVFPPRSWGRMGSNPERG